MPTYEYHCTKCGHTFEKSQSMNDAALSVCVKELCGLKKWGKGKVKRAISGGGGLIFKGSGFYITDYRSEKYKEAAKKDSAASTPAASSDSKSLASTPSTSSGSKAETKLAAKTESKPAKTNS
jgi:putative FmdB family regulatory protein